VVANELSSYLGASQRGGVDAWVRKAGTLSDRIPAKSKMLVRQFLEARLQACKSAKLSTTFSPDGLCRQRFLVAVLIELYVLAEPKELPDSRQQQPAALTVGDGLDVWMVAFWSHCARSSSSPPFSCPQNHIKCQTIPIEFFQTCYFLAMESSRSAVRMLLRNINCLFVTY